MSDTDAPRPQSWQTLACETLLARPPWLELQREQVALPSGRVIDDFYRVVLPHFAAMVAITAEDRWVLVRGYKHGLGRVTLSPPAGLIEPGEDPLLAAQRELREETGYTSSDWQALGEFVVDGNRQCGTMHLFCATGARLTDTIEPCDAEELNVELFSRAEMIAALRRGEFGTLAGAAAVSIALALQV
jgi:ADP-ribose pyrophosphatase